MDDMVKEICRFLIELSDNHNWTYTPEYSRRGFEGYTATWVGSLDISNIADELLEKIEEWEKKNG